MTSDLVTLGQDGPYRLTIHHSHGIIIEYFHSTTAALDRQGVLEDLLGKVAFHGAALTRKRAKNSLLAYVRDEEETS